MIQSGDLDPVYIAAAGADMPLEQRSRWLLAYWCFYHTGAASWLSEQPRFWDAMRVAARNDDLTPLGARWPRASERRYFRGLKCERAVLWLQDYSKGDPCYLVDRLRWKSTHTEIMTEVQRWPLFGPWIAFKVADMMERVDGAAVSFSDDILTFYEEPRAGLELSAKAAGMQGSKEDVAWQMGYMLRYFGSHCAPPAGFGPLSTWPKRRLCNVQEIETICCKWKSHRAGRYTVGKDILEVRHALKGWGATAERLLAACPREVPT